MSEPERLILAGLAAVSGGAINALAGGGTLVTFPVLVACGMSNVVANVSNTIALCPGYLGAALAQRRDLVGQRRRLLALAPAGAAGGLLGAWLLLNGGEQSFRSLVPWLILTATLLLALQDRLKRAVGRAEAGAPDQLGRAAVVIGVCSIYGGYFGAGLSVVVLAALGLFLDDTLTRLNALKQELALAINGAAAVLLAFSDDVDWRVVGVMAVGALAGGALGGRLASRIPAIALRRVIVALGLVVTALYFTT